MDLREYVHKLTDFIWEREHKSQKPVDAAILSYVQDAVIAELEYRRRMSDLDHFGRHAGRAGHGLVSEAELLKRNRSLPAPPGNRPPSKGLFRG